MSYEIKKLQKETCPRKKLSKTFSGCLSTSKKMKAAAEEFFEYLVSTNSYPLTIKNARNRLLDFSWLRCLHPENFGYTEEHFGDINAHQVS
jgi:hypothetical protein